MLISSDLVAEEDQRADIDLEQGLITLPSTKSGCVQYIHLTEEAKLIFGGLIPGNTSVWVPPVRTPTHT